MADKERPVKRQVVTTPTADDMQDPREIAIVLGVLTAVDRDARVSQRMLGQELGIALGIANAYIKRCVRKGLIKMTQAPLNRYAYYLTPRGFHEKSRLTVEYLRSSFDFFRDARRQLTELFKQEARPEGSLPVRAVLFGAGDLAEIAVLSAAEVDIELIGVIDADHPAERCAGLAVLPDFGAAIAAAGGRTIDLIVVTDLNSPQAGFDRAVAAVAPLGSTAPRVIAPDLLRISRIRGSHLRFSGRAVSARRAAAAADPSNDLRPDDLKMAGATGTK